MARAEIDDRLDAQLLQFLDALGRRLGAAVQAVADLVQVRQARPVELLRAQDAGRVLGVGSAVRLAAGNRQTVDKAANNIHSRGYAAWLDSLLGRVGVGYASA